ncbi:hypothetical protein VCSRO98_1283 [Vibrio cholerae]|nr:GGDEF family domain protein [Vibrio cholerae]GIC11694.1 hypothetical protein VCSRO98_1283 [Vibrio cholerae]
MLKHVRVIVPLLVLLFFIKARCGERMMNPK